MSVRLDHLKRFYDLLDRLGDRAGGPRYLASCDGRMDWPDRGVYFFFEHGETRSDSGAGLRVVRVGTHALRLSRTTLWRRLAQHRGTVTHGGGNHRGSIFRKLVGAAMAVRQPSVAVESWGQGQTAPRDVTVREQDLERRVSKTIGRMPFLWLDVPDEPGRDSLRGVVERNAIALLSNYERSALDPPSGAWLGHDCPRKRVRGSGLWNNNHVNEDYDPAFLDVLEKLIEDMALVGAPSPEALPADPPPARSRPVGLKTASPEDDQTWRLPASSDLSDTLLIVPCSKSKATAAATLVGNGQEDQEELPGRPGTGSRIGSELPASLAERLDRARAANRERAAMDERTLVPAWQRYSGNFYRAAADALAEAVERGLHVLILSGGYGVLLAREPIGLYEAVLKPSWWPERVLEDVLAGYARRHGLKRMRAFVSRTTSYRKIVERTDWKKAGIEDAVLLTPARKALSEFDSPGGASRVSQNLIVRTQGEAFAALIGGAALDSNWRSEAGLALTCRKLV